MAFPFLQRESLAELARHFQLQGYTPALELEGLLTGIDNLRHDVYLSPKFVEVVREHIFRLIGRDAQVEDLMEKSQALSDIPPQIFRPSGQEESKPANVLEFKPALADLLVESLNH